MSRPMFGSLGAAGSMLFDTDVLIWLSRGDRKAVRVMDAAQGLSLSIVSLMELLQGAKDRKEQRRIRCGLAESGFTIIPIREAISHQAVMLIEDHALKDGLRLADALIAATALDAGLPLVTGNFKHFKPIAGLDVIPFRAS